MLEKLLETIDQKKRLIDQHRPFAASIVTQLEEYIDVEYTYTSNAIEGNTLTRRETMLVLLKGQTIAGKSMKDHLEATNHRSAIDHIRQIPTKVVPINAEDINYVHALVLKGIDDRYAGKYRDVEVLIGGTQREFCTPSAIAATMQAFSQWLVQEQENMTMHPVQLAAQAHYRLVDIHPYIDGNGRTARLLMNLILLKYGYFITIIDSEMPNRQGYYAALELADKGDENAFEVFIADQVNKTADVFVKLLGEK